MKFFKLTTTAILGALLLTQTQLSYGARGSEGGGGGNAEEMRIDEIRNDLLKWIQLGGAKALTFPSYTSLDEYESEMKYYLQPHTVTTFFVEEDHPTNQDLQVSVDGKPKTCRGYFSPARNNRPFVVCNINRFNNTPEAEQYRLIHHEYAGLANLEQNQGSSSDYFISNQITSYLRPEVVLRLAVTSRRLQLNGSENYDSIHENDDGSVTIVKPKFKSLNSDKNLLLSLKSDLNGVCKLFGLGDYVDNSFQAQWSRESKIVLDDSGSFHQYNHEKGNYLDSLICKKLNQTEIPVSKNYEKLIVNDDNSVTVLKPMFSNATGSGNLSISTSTKVSDLCKFYGFNQYVEKSATRRYTKNSRVRLNSDGTFKKLIHDSGDYYHSFTCK